MNETKGILASPLKELSYKMTTSFAKGLEIIATRMYCYVYIMVTCNFASFHTQVNFFVI